LGVGLSAQQMVTLVQENKIKKNNSRNRTKKEKGFLFKQQIRWAQIQLKKKREININYLINYVYHN
jgi:hypothetical protein